MTRQYLDGNQVTFLGCIFLLQCKSSQFCDPSCIFCLEIGIKNEFKLNKMTKLYQKCPIKVKGIDDPPKKYNQQSGHKKKSRKNKSSLSPEILWLDVIMSAMLIFFWWRRRRGLRCSLEHEEEALRTKVKKILSLDFCRVESNVNKIQKQTTPDKHECTQSTISTSSKSS